MSNFDLRAELGPIFEVRMEGQHPLVLQVGTKTGSTGGTAGPAGPPGQAGIVTITSSQPLGLYRAVTIDGFYAEPTVNGLSAYAGVTTVAVASGVETSIIRTGLISEAGWTWTPNFPIFVGASGTLTQVVSSVPMRRIGWAISATQINLDPQPVIGA